MKDKIIRLTKKQAGDIVSKACFRVTDTDSQDYGRELLHCFLGGIGADWNKDSILKLIAKSKDRAWVIGRLFGHELGIMDDKNVYYFDVKFEGK